MLERMEAAADEAFNELQSSTTAKAAEPAQVAPPAIEPEATAVPEKIEAEAPSASVETAPVSTPSRSKDYEDFLTKWGGPSRDPDVAARAAWDMNNRLAKEATAPPPTETVVAPTATTPAPEVVPVDVARLDDSLRSIKESYDQVKQDHLTIQKKQHEVRGRIEELVDHLTGNELELDAEAAARKELRAKRAEEGRLKTLRLEIEREAAVLQDRHELKTTQREQAIELGQIRKERENTIREQATRTEDEALERFGVAFFKAIPEVAKQGEAIPAELLEDWKDYAKEQSHLRLKVEDLPTANIDQFLAETKTKFLAMQDRAHRAKSAQYAAQKLKDTTVNAPAGAAAVVTEGKKTGFRSQRDVDAFMDAASNF